MGLSENMERVWRYFRGITEGLLYIHEQVSTGVVFMLVDCKQIVPLNSSSCGDPVPVSYTHLTLPTRFAV